MKQRRKLNSFRTAQNFVCENGNARIIVQLTTQHTSMYVCTYDMLQCQLLTTELVVASDLTTCKQKYDPHLVASAKQAERWPLSQDNRAEPVAERSSAIAEGPRYASCQLKSCQLPHNSAETTCMTSPEPSISCR